MHSLKNTVTISLLFFLAANGTFAQLPTITSFSPAMGPAGSTVTINGSNFDPLTYNNVVFFGAVRAQVVTASSSILTVLVPRGANYKPITVQTNYLTAYSKQPFILTFGSGGSVFATSSFVPHLDTSDAFQCFDIAVADFNWDGLPDFVVPSYNGNKISVIKNTGSPGNLSFAPQIDYATGQNPYSVVTADIDGDGKLDIIVTNWSSNYISIYRNTSFNTLSFIARFDFPTGLAPQGLAIGDVDGDGKPDIVTSNVNSFSVSVLRNTSSPASISFAPKIDYSVGNGDISVALGDIDGDGKPDISVVLTNSNRVAVLRNLSTPGIISFSTAVTFPTGNRPYNLAVGDLDGDGKSEIVLTNNYSGTFSIFRNTSTIGSVSFSPKIDYAVDIFPQRVCITDLDGDGKPDIAVSCHGVAVYKNISTPGIISFLSKVNYPFSYPSGISSSDFDADGKPEIITSEDYSVQVLRNSIPISAILCPNGNTSFTSTTIGNTYQWQSSIDSINFTNLANNSTYTGTNTATLSLNNLPTQFYGYEYRCITDNIPGDPFSIKFNNQWIGSASTAWEDNINWSCAVTPDANTDVVITSGTIIIHLDVTIRSLTLSPGVSLTVVPPARLTITH